jgi:anti-sigma regulatory factor (Ser/Thr protein kinase)
MDSPAGSPQRSSGIRQRAAILGSVTIPGRPEHVSGTRAFIARTVAGVPGVDAEAATLLTSELVTNAIQHTDSGMAGGTVTVVAIGVPGGVLVEVVDDGSGGAPIVKGDLYAAEGHGLFLVQQLATQWGYLRDRGGTTVWFHLPAAAATRPAAEAEPSRGTERPAAARVDQAEKTTAAGYLLAASAAVSTAAQMRATSSSSVTYGGIV